MRNHTHPPPPWVLPPTTTTPHTRSTSQLFVNMSEGLAASGFLAMAAAVVAFAYLWLRGKYTVDPNQVL